MTQIPPINCRIYLNDPNLSECALDINFKEERVREFHEKKAQFVPKRLRSDSKKVEENDSEEEVNNEGSKVPTEPKPEAEPEPEPKLESQLIDMDEKRNILEGKLLELNELLESIEQNDNQNIMFQETVTATDAGVDIGLLRIRKAALLNSLGRFDEAFTYLDESFDLINNKAAVLYRMAQSQYCLGNYIEAFELFEKCLDYDPACNEALYGIRLCIGRLKSRKDRLACVVLT